MERFQHPRRPVPLGQSWFENSGPRLTWKTLASNAVSGNQTRIETFCIGNEPLGYAVLRERFQREPMAGRYKDFRLMSLMDFGFYSEHPDRFPLLVSYVVEAFRASSCEVLELVTSIPPLQAELQRRGILAIGSGVPLTFSLPAAKCPISLPMSVDQWHATLYDADGFSF